jgi:hypothetical protein
MRIISSAIDVDEQEIREFLKCVIMSPAESLRVLGMDKNQAQGFMVLLIEVSELESHA